MFDGMKFIQFGGTHDYGYDYPAFTWSIAKWNHPLDYIINDCYIHYMLIDKSDITVKLNGKEELELGFLNEFYFVVSDRGCDFGYLDLDYIIVDGVKYEHDEEKGGVMQYVE